MNPLHKIVGKGEGKDEYLILFKWSDNLDKPCFNELHFFIQNDFLAQEHIRESLYLKKVELVEIIEEIAFEDEVKILPPVPQEFFTVPNFPTNEPVQKENLFKNKIAPVEFYTLIVTPIKDQETQKLFEPLTQEQPKRPTEALNQIQKVLMFRRYNEHRIKVKTGSEKPHKIKKAKDENKDDFVIPDTQ